MHVPLEQSLPLDCGNYDNRGLFADHFLRDPQRLRAMEEWEQAAGVEETRQKIAHLWQKRASRFNGLTNEAQTENGFIRPVLNILWGENCFQVQVAIPNVEGRRQPDYAFFGTADERQQADKHKGALEYWRNVPALGDAKAWETSLDTQSSSGQNPSAQVCNYLYRSRARWGILTNGRLWRLYEREKSSAGGIYYEVNLVDLLNRPDVESFKYFYLFFRREAFVPDPKDPDRLSFVEKVFKGSVDYATEVGERLKESVYDALRQLMNGFLAHPANGLDSSDADTVQLVHDNSLVLLYRLLFILYAEHRGILPCDNEEYGRYSLRALHEEINANLLRRPYSSRPSTLWRLLCNLFSLIDCGFEEDGRVIVPAYNGGLFSPEKHPHIAYASQANAKQWQIGDRSLAEAVDLLAREREQWDKPSSKVVDYATLEVQHLGSIYEGLLELQPHVAAEPLIETIEQGKAVFRPEREVSDPRPIRGKRGQPPQPARRIKPGEAYLVTNRGERKATGSYYTPKYIVDYIVENTVGPVAEEAARKVAELRAEADKEIRKRERLRREREKSSARDAAAEIAKLDKEIEDQKRRLLEPYLALKILDPAMGSGHFLVGAADHLSLAMATDPNLIPPEETDSENPQAFYKRLIVERCLYGVDLNPLAVELAKLSLWLHTVSKNKALSFLDHHLRCGNSLIGARIEDDLMKTPPQFDERRKLMKVEHDLVSGIHEALYAGPLVAILELLHKISDIPTHDVQTEKLKETYYEELEKLREKFRAVGNCWLAPYFGAPVEFDQYQRAVTALRGSADEWQALADEPWFQAAQSVACQKHFFHWELEFPEVFFDKTGFKAKDHRGFTVVIGNPPYGGLLREDDRRFLEMAYSTAVRYKNTALHFIELAARSARETGHCGLIVPKSLTFSESWNPGRDLVLPRLQLLVDVRQAFAEVLLEQVVIVFTAATQSSPGYLIASARDGCFSLPTEVRRELCKLLDVLLAGIDRHSLDVFHKIVSSKMFFGYITETFRGLPLQQRLSSHGTHRVHRGDHIGRFQLLDSFEFVSATDLRDCEEKAKRLRQPKLVSQNIVAHVTQPRDHVIIMSALDTGNCVNLDTVNNTVCTDPDYDLRFLLSLLNSRLTSWYAYLFVYNQAIRTMHFDETYVGKIPIPRIAFTTAKGERARLLKEGKRLYEQTLETMNRGGAR